MYRLFPPWTVSDDSIAAHDRDAVIEERGSTDALLWPVKDVVNVTVADPTNFPDITLELLFYANSTCRETPIRNYFFSNGTIKNATYGDMLDDMEPIYNDTTKKTEQEAYFNMTERILWDLWKYTNNTRSMINFH